MSRLNRGLFTKFMLMSFGVLVFQQIVILFLLTDTCRGEAEPSQTIRTVVDADVTLPCNLEPGDDAVSETLVWLRPDLEPRFVHVWLEGQNLTVQNLTAEQNPYYTGRTSVSIERLKHGDLSLKLSEVKVSDNGTCTYCFPLKDKYYSVELVVENAKSPCDQGSLIHSTTPTTTTTTPTGKDETLHDWPYLEEEETLNTKTADSSSSLCLPQVYFYAIFTVVAVVLLLAFLFAFWKRNHTVSPQAMLKMRKPAPTCERFSIPTFITTTINLQTPTFTDAGREDPPPASRRSETQGLLSTEEKQDIASTLFEQQTETTKLRDELLSQLEEVGREKDKNKERLHSVEKELETDTGHKTQELLKEKGIFLESKWKLDEMKTEKEKVLLQTEKLLRTIDTVTNKIAGQTLMYEEN